MTMGPDRLSKVGEVTETPDGRRALLNGEGEAYLAQDAVIVIWDFFDRKTTDEVAEELAVASDRSPDVFKEPIQKVAKVLQSVGLLEPSP